MKRNHFVRLILCASLGWNFSAAQIFAADFDATNEIVGRNTGGLETPVNQRVTPAGALVELPGMRPNALALSPDGKLLVTAGLTHELVAVNPATGEIVQRISFPPDKAQAEAPVAAGILNADQKAQLSLTGIAFSPDGSRIYLANVNGDIKVFSVDANQRTSPLISFALPPANAPLRAEEISTGIAFRAMAKKSTSAAISPTTCLSWTRRRAKCCGLGTWASRRSMWRWAKIKFTSATGAVASRTPTALLARRDKELVFAWMRAALPAKVR